MYVPFANLPIYLLLHTFRARLRPEVNSNQFEISPQGKISLLCKVTSLSAFT